MASSTLAGSRMMPFPPAASIVALNERGNSGETKTTADELVHRDLVRGIEDGRHAVAGLQRLASKCERGKPYRVRRLEGEVRHMREVEARRARHARRPGEAVRDRHPHVRRTELGDQRAVAILDDAVNDRLRMDDDVDLVGRQSRTDDAPR